MTTFPAFHLTARQASFFHTPEPSPPGSTPGLVGCFPQIMKLNRGFPSSQSASRVLTAHLCPLEYPAAHRVSHLQPGAGLRLFPLDKAQPITAMGHMKFITREPGRRVWSWLYHVGKSLGGMGTQQPILYMLKTRASVAVMPNDSNMLSLSSPHS